MIKGGKILKIAFIYSEKNKGYEKTIESIINELKNEKSNTQNVFDINIAKNSRKKYDLYVVFSDDKEDFDIDIMGLKGKPMLITNNLTSEYINYVITKVTDIVYSENNIATILNRINGNLKRLHE